MSTIFGSEVAEIFDQYKNDGSLDIDKIRDDLYYIKDPNNDNYYSLINDDPTQQSKNLVYIDPDEMALAFNEDGLNNLTEFQDQLRYQLQSQENTLNAWKSRVEGQYVWKYIQQLKDFNSIDNPVMKVIRKLSMSMNIEYSDIEDVLKKLMDKLNGKGVNDFTFSPEEQESVNEAYDLLELAYSVIYSAMNNNDPNNPYPHNQYYNKLIREYGLNLEELPEIDEKIGQLMLQQINALRKEIGNEVNDDNGNK